MHHGFAIAVIDATSRFACAHEYVGISSPGAPRILCHRCGFARELLPIGPKGAGNVRRFPLLETAAAAAID
jgi:hypothetical protein